MSLGVTKSHSHLLMVAPLELPLLRAGFLFFLVCLNIFTGRYASAYTRFPVCNARKMVELKKNVYRAIERNAKHILSLVVLLNTPIQFSFTKQRERAMRLQRVRLVRCNILSHIALRTGETSVNNVYGCFFNSISCTLYCARAH